MSRTLKRPMFRKGGEVMEGIMTGIKPREMFQDKGVSDDMAEQLKNVQQKVELIDALLDRVMDNDSNFRDINRMKLTTWQRK